MLALFVLVLAADQIRGSVVDPHDRPIAAAELTITCEGIVSATQADADGAFAVDGGAGRACEARVSSPGFRTLIAPVVIGQPPLIFRLTPAGWEERIEITGGEESTPAHAATSPLGSAMLTRDRLAVAGPDTARWLTLAHRSAGVPIGQHAFTVNGMPASVVPAADAISTIAVTADPFSVEAAGADRVTVDITAEAPQRWQFALSPGMLTPTQRDLLLDAATFQPQQRLLSVGGPLTAGRRIATLVTFSDFSTRERPAYVERAGGTDQMASAIESRSEHMTWSTDLFGHLGRWTIQGSASGGSSSFVNAGVGGRSSPAGALDRDGAFERRQMTWRYAGSRLVWHGGASSESEHRDVRARTSGPGTIVADRLVSGAPDVLYLSTRQAVSVIRTVASAPGTRRRPWLIGAELESASNDEERLYNPEGQAFSPEVDGIPTARLFREAPARVAVYHRRSAAFAQQVLINSSRVFARAGIRAEWQPGYDTAWSPRLALGLPIKSFIVGANAGTFSGVWDVHDALEREFRLTTVSTIQRNSERSRLAFVGDGARRSDTVVRAAVVRPMRTLVVGVEQSWRAGRHLSGLTRHRLDDRLFDVLDHSRVLTRRQTRVRVDLRRRQWLATSFYEFARSIDDTAGSFHLPASSARIGTERGPSTGIPAHAVTAVVSGSVRGLRVIATARAASGTPYTMLTGSDPEGLLTFTGRTHTLRNHNRLPASSEVSTYVARQFRLPWRALIVDAGARLENVFSTLTVFDVERFAGSTLSGRPVSAARGRALSVWTTIGRR